jgi:hypothetical protein
MVISNPTLRQGNLLDSKSQGTMGAEYTSLLCPQGLAYITKRRRYKIHRQMLTCDKHSFSSHILHKHPWHLALSLTYLFFADSGKLLQAVEGWDISWPGWLSREAFMLSGLPLTGPRTLLYMTKPERKSKNFGAEWWNKFCIHTTVFSHKILIIRYHSSS